MSFWRMRNVDSSSCIYIYIRSCYIHGNCKCILHIYIYRYTHVTCIHIYIYIYVSSFMFCIYICLYIYRYTYVDMCIYMCFIARKSESQMRARRAILGAGPSVYVVIYRNVPGFSWRSRAALGCEHTCTCLQLWTCLLSWHSLRLQLLSKGFRSSWCHVKPARSCTPAEETVL